MLKQVKVIVAETSEVIDALYVDGCDEFAVAVDTKHRSVGILGRACVGGVIVYEMLHVAKREDGCDMVEVFIKTMEALARGLDEDDIEMHIMYGRLLAIEYNRQIKALLAA